MQPRPRTKNLFPSVVQAGVRDLSLLSMFLKFSRFTSLTVVPSNSSMRSILASLSFAPGDVTRCVSWKKIPWEFYRGGGGCQEELSLLISLSVQFVQCSKDVLGRGAISRKDYSVCPCCVREDFFLLT